MRFRQERITFQEANRRYAELKQRYDAGTITDKEFEEQLKQLMALDDQGRWWAKSRTTGEWHYYDGNGWVKATPPDEPSKPSQEPTKPSIHKPSYEELIRICANYDGPRFYVDNAIPSEVLARSRASFPIPDGEYAAAFLDTSSTVRSVTYGNRGGFGLAVCEEGLRWRNDKFMRSGGRFIGWSDFSGVSIDARWRRFGKYDLEMGEGNVLFAMNKLMDGDELVRLLREIQALVTRSPTG